MATKLPQLTKQKIVQQIVSDQKPRVRRSRTKNNSQQLQDNLLSKLKEYEEMNEIDIQISNIFDKKVSLGASHIKTSKNKENKIKRSFQQRGLNNSFTSGLDNNNKFDKSLLDSSNILDQSDLELEQHQKKEVYISSSQKKKSIKPTQHFLTELETTSQQKSLKTSQSNIHQKTKVQNYDDFEDLKEVQTMIDETKIRIDDISGDMYSLRALLKDLKRENEENGIQMESLNVIEKQFQDLWSDDELEILKQKNNQNSEKKGQMNTNFKRRPISGIKNKSQNFDN